MEGRTILDIGCGSMPWLLYRHGFQLSEVAKITHLLKPEDPRTLASPLMEELTTLGPSDEYVCIEPQPEELTKASDALSRLKGEKPERKPWNVRFLPKNGTDLPYADGSIHAVILANILTAPPPDSMSETGGMDGYPAEDCISQKTKRALIHEALRVLRPDGQLVLDVSKTPCYAERALRWIEQTLVVRRKLHLFARCGEFVPSSDDWHLCHFAYRKGEAPFRGPPTVIPWTATQVAYAKALAAQYNLPYC